MERAISQDLAKKAIDRWGNDPQLIMALEELAECSNAIAKLFRNRTTMDELSDEIADVYIMLAQIEYMYAMESRVDEKVVAKRIRLCHMIENKGGSDEDN